MAKSQQEHKKEQSFSVPFLHLQQHSKKVTASSLLWEPHVNAEWLLYGLLFVLKKFSWSEERSIHEGVTKGLFICIVSEFLI